jgi:CMP-N,N'-diacetyllegionaminic acid synthase
MTFLKKKVVALIPVKNKSQRLKNKNFKLLNNKKTLLDITLQSALKSNFIDKIFISSNNLKLKKKITDKKIFFQFRSKKFCTNSSTADDVILNFINLNLNKFFKLDDYIIYLQVTSPKRTNTHIDNSFSLMKKKCADSLISITETDKYLWKSLVVKENKIIPLFKQYIFKNDQNLPKIYNHNGAIYIFKVRNFLKDRSIPIKNAIGFYMNSNDSIDINTYEDFNLFNQNLKK